jgi:hypothetical protein
MPTKDELAALQAADPETMALLDWIQKGRQESAIPDLPSKWRKEVKYLHLLGDVLFFRPVLDPHDGLVEALLGRDRRPPGALTRTRATQGHCGCGHALMSNHARRATPKPAYVLACV